MRNQIIAFTIVLAASVGTGCKRAALATMADNYFKAHGADVLKCFHSSGVYGRTSDMSVEGPNTAIGSIYWTGSLLGTEYITTVRLHFSDEGPVRAELVRDTSLIPSFSNSCTLR